MKILEHLKETVGSFFSDKRRLAEVKVHGQYIQYIQNIRIYNKHDGRRKGNKSGELSKWMWG